MWQAITDFLLKAHASSLGHDAVIEIMIALLGIMVAVLTLVAGLFAAVVAVLGLFGYNTIREEAAKKATSIAAEVAKSTAAETAKTTTEEYLRRFGQQEQASGLSESQNEMATSDTSKKDQPKKLRRKATNDKGLKEGHK